MLRSSLSKSLIFAALGMVSIASAKEDLWLPNAGKIIPAGPEATVINFDDGAVAPLSILGAQYAGLGVTFSPGHTSPGVVNPVDSTQGFATNSSMEITATDVGGGVSAPISGNLLHSFGGWLAEDGDPSFTMTFSSPVNAISAVVGGVFTPASTVLYAIGPGDVVLGSIAASAANTSTIALSGLGNFSKAVMTLGSFNDWVGVDNITFNVVPEPTSLGLVGVGAALLLLRRRG